MDIPLPTQVIREHIQNHGLRKGIQTWASKKVYRKFRPDGENVFEKDWDVLLILDACRADLMNSVSEEYEFVEGQRSITSVGSTSIEWIDKTFTNTSEDTLANTGYITGNTFSEHVDSLEDDLAVLDEVWKYGWDEELGTVPPRVITDRAITISRKTDLDQFVIHYMQPHVPFLDDIERSGKMKRNQGEEVQTHNIWDKLEDGSVTVDDFWPAYKNNLRYVLDEVELLRDNMDADRMVISSDHGNATGEKGFYGHGPQMPVETTMQVPWEITEATDKGSHSPEEYDTESSDMKVEERLRELGYKQ